MNTISDALRILFGMEPVLLILLGTLLGMVLGAIPGLNGGLAIMILLPMTFSMDGNIAIPALVAIYVGSVSGGCIGSIILGIPGTASSVATVYDGYEFTKKGDPVRALSAAVISNFIGTTGSVIVALAISPLVAKWAVMLGPWEYFGLSLCAISMVVGVAKGNMIKGFIAVGIAFLVGSVGLAPISGTPRFTFDSYYLSGGFNLVSTLMGMFAGRTILLEYAKGSKTDQADMVQIKPFKFPGADLVRNIGNIIRSFIIGLWIGFLPGLGGALSNVVAYAQAKNSSKTPEEFGHGCIDGVIAPETANNASVGGALIPMISLGIPGDSITAVLLGGLILHGVEAGPLIYTKNPTFVNLIYFAVLLSAVMALLIQTIGMPAFPAVLKVPYHFLYPSILVMCFIGSYLSMNNIFAVFVTIGFTALGVAMAYFNLPISPFILAFVLSNMIESNLRKAISYSDNGIMDFITRPFSLLLLLVAVASVVWPFVKDRMPKNEQKAT